jgi:hypothetical protein
MTAIEACRFTHAVAGQLAYALRERLQRSRDRGRTGAACKQVGKLVDRFPAVRLMASMAGATDPATASRWTWVGLAPVIQVVHLESGTSSLRRNRHPW